MVKLLPTLRSSRKTENWSPSSYPIPAWELFIANGFINLVAPLALRLLLIRPISHYITLISKLREMGSVLAKEQQLQAANIPFDETVDALHKLFFQFLRCWQMSQWNSLACRKATRPCRS